MGIGSSVVIVLVAAAGGALLIAASLIDLRHHRIPNRITYGALVFCALAAVIGGLSGHGTHVTAGLVGGAAFGLLLFIPHVVEPTSMGLGDVKLAAPLGFAIGWTQGAVVPALLTVGWTLAAASCIGLLMAAGNAASRNDRLRSGQAVPFGPALSLAASLAVGVSLF